jgi:hypothetical protein
METSQKDKKAMMNLSWKNYGHNGSWSKRDEILPKGDECLCREDGASVKWKQIQKKQTVVEQQQVPKEEAAMETIGTPKGQCGDQWWTVGPWNPLNERITCIIVQGIPKGRKFGKRRPAQPKCNSGIRDQGINQQLLQKPRELSMRPSHRL